MAAPHIEQHSEEQASFIKTPQQLIVVVVMAFVVPITLITLLVSLVMSASKYTADHPAMSDGAVAQRIQPVGQVQIGEVSGTTDAAPPGPVAAASAAPSSKSGEEVYKQVCAACHTTGVLNAPKTGDQAAWAPLIKEGLDVLTADAIKGIRQMPPRGGNPNLSDLEVRRSVVYMANLSGANFKEPEAPAAVAAAPAPAEASAPAPAPAETKAAVVADGKAIYEKACTVCHVAGVAGAPRTGDKTAWAPRIKQGPDALYAATIKGKGAMPPKGGAVQLSDDQVKAAVDYMIGQSK
jgi:cytochrome c5